VGRRMIRRGRIDWLIRRRFGNRDRCDTRAAARHRPAPSARTCHTCRTEIKRLIRDPLAIYAKHQPQTGRGGGEPAVHPPDAPSLASFATIIRTSSIGDGNPALLTNRTLLEPAKKPFKTEAPWPRRCHC